MTHVVAMVTVLVMGQAYGQPFLGEWKCEYFGRTLARLELHDTNGALGGRISIGAFHVDAEGKLDVVIEEASYYTPIFDVAVRDGVLSFARLEENDDHQFETHRFELRVSGDTARLVFLISDKTRAAARASGMGAPQPVTFKRIDR